MTTKMVMSGQPIEAHKTTVVGPGKRGHTPTKMEIIVNEIAKLEKPPMRGRVPGIAHAMQAFDVLRNELFFVGSLDELKNTSRYNENDAG